MHTYKSVYWLQENEMILKTVICHTGENFLAHPNTQHGNPFSI